jgi:hypothetical protein
MSGKRAIAADSRLERQRCGTTPWSPHAGGVSYSVVSYSWVPVWRWLGSVGHGDDGRPKFMIGDVGVGGSIAGVADLAVRG